MDSKTPALATRQSSSPTSIAQHQLLAQLSRLEKLQTSMLDDPPWHLTAIHYNIGNARALFLEHIFCVVSLRVKEDLVGTRVLFPSERRKTSYGWVLHRTGTYAETVKKAQLLEGSTDFTDRIKGKFVKKEMTSGQSSAKPTNGKKRSFNITEGSSQERKLKVFVPNTPAKSNCKHCDKPGHTADESLLRSQCLIRQAYRDPYKVLSRSDLTPSRSLQVSIAITGETEDELYTQEDGNDQE
ncbi:hypothetical protein Taro_043183 [Colocasia esculenta]|uniref:Uncharacterized protein n=1 Tax=Colocasia esculenta TaxID=4460 RepID=A0A843WYD7_COLES|nr:hypothetical protein [Colocasia esculenta]